MNKQGKEKNDGFLGNVSFIAKLGNLICENQTDKNKWKKRMLSTVPGIDFPDDFDGLPEEEKEARLDGAIDTIKR